MKAKVGLYVVAGIVALGLLTWGGIYVNGFFNAEREKMRHNVVGQSLSYQKGLRNELNDLYLQYRSADSDGRSTIKAVVRSKFGSENVKDLPQHLEQFLTQMMGH